MGDNMKELRFSTGNPLQIFDSMTDGSLVYAARGSGSVYTYRAYGTAGQTVEVRGGFVGDAWADMQQVCVLTVGDPDSVNNPQSTVRQHTWPVLMVDGDARIKIARGAA